MFDDTENENIMLESELSLSCLEEYYNESSEELLFAIDNGYKGRFIYFDDFLEIYPLINIV